MQPFTLNASPTAPSPTAKSPQLFRFPVRRGSSGSDSTTSGRSSVSSILERTRSSSASSVSSTDSDLEAKEAALKGEMRTNCIGTRYCKCDHCHIGDFVFDTEEEFLIYYEALKDVLDAKESGRSLQIHCHESGGMHYTA